MAWIGRFDDFADASGRGQPRMTKNRSFQGGRNFKQLNLPTEDANCAFLTASDGFTPIANISNHLQTVSIAGVVIAREGPRSIVSKKGSGTERRLLCLTVRDGPTSFINVTCWGGQEYVTFLHSKATIGDVIEIKEAQVQEKSNPSDERFKPWTPSSCQLTVSENNSSISPYNGGGMDQFITLLHMPTKASDDYYSLDDIQTNGINLQGEHVNILAVVKKLWPAKEITTKTGKKTSKVDVVLCDETCLAFNLTLWDSSTELAEMWHPMETVIFASDVKIMYNDFRSAMTASSDSKTIFTSDPDIPNAHRLLNFAKDQSTFASDNNSNIQFVESSRDPDIQSITNVLTNQEAKSLQMEVAAYDGRAAYGVLYAFLSHFDVDGGHKSCLRHICPKCHRTVLESTGYVCSNDGCPGGDAPFEHQVEYSIPVSFSDHSGTLESCHLQSSVAEQILGCKAQEFPSLPTPQKTAMKWNYLLEKTKAVIKIRKASGKSNKSFVSVLALEKVAN